MIFEWDQDKAESNFKKHKIAFEEAESVFCDPLSLTIPDPEHSVDEFRFVDIGISKNNRLLIIAYTEREDRIRIITARKATKTERQKYEEKNR
ncbi:BrnT family toxin [soil metagenome]